MAATDSTATGAAATGAAATGAAATGAAATGAAAGAKTDAPDGEPSERHARRGWTPPLGAALLALVLALVLGTVASLLYVANVAGKRAASVAAGEIAAIIARETFRDLAALLGAARDAVESAASLTTAGVLDPEDTATLERLLLAQLSTREGVSSISWAAANGDFTAVLREGAGAGATHRPKRARHGEDEPETSVERPDSGPSRAPDGPTPGDGDDPLRRHWVRDALGTRDVVWAAPYRRHTSGEPGIGVARAVGCAGRAAPCVFAAEVGLGSISHRLEELGRRHGARAFVVTADGRLLIASGASIAGIAPAAGVPGELPRAADTGDAIVAAALAALRGRSPGGLDPHARPAVVRIESDGARHFAAFAPLSVETQRWTVGVVVDDFSLRRWLASHRALLLPWAAAVVAGMALLGFALWLPVRRDLARLRARIATEASGTPDRSPAIPEFRALADRLDLVQAQLRARNGELGAALAEATRADQAKARFLTQMSHELRTPLNAVIGFAELARMRAAGTPGGDAALPGYLDDVLVAARHLLALIERVLEYVRSESSAGALQEERFPVAEAMRTAATVTATAAAARGIRISRSGGEGIDIVADRARLCEALVNLIDNAVVHGVADGDIELGAARAADGGLVLSVRDAGPGMTRDQIAAALTPFARAERGVYVATKRGLGLGIGIVGEIARRHGGDLSIESMPGAGTTVSIRLPAARIHSAPGSARAP